MRHCGLILFLALFLAGCSGNTRNGDALSAHQTAEKVKRQLVEDVQAH